MKNNHMSIEQIIGICASHRELIGEAVESRRQAASDSKGFLDFRECRDIRAYRNTHQYFAVDGPTARQLVVLEDEETGNRWYPAILDGSVFSVYPEEGRGGYAHLFFIHRREGSDKIIDKWLIIWTDGGWVNTSELNLSPVEIRLNIAEDIERGENVFFPKPAGWV